MDLGGALIAEEPVAGDGGWSFASLERRAYGAIVADPPWNFRSRTALQASNWKVRRDAAKHYATMNSDDIAALPVRELAARDCHLFLWVTGPALPFAFDVMAAWGFRYSGIAFTWVKLRRAFDKANPPPLVDVDAMLHFGLGMTTRKNAEFCLLGRRGNCRRAAKNVREIIMAPVRQHSRKPDEFRDRIEAYVGPGIRVAELFAREQRPGWDCWGNEVGKFAGEDAR